MEEGLNIRNHLFVDLAVYRDYGNFRLLLSGKFGEMGKRNFQIWLPNEQKVMDESQISEDILYVHGFAGMQSSFTYLCDLHYFSPYDT